MEERKPYLCVNMVVDVVLNETLIRDWLRIYKIEILNVAGSRESKKPGIQEYVRLLMVNVLWS
jgi:hypothetical protein